MPTSELKKITGRDAEGKLQSLIEDECLDGEVLDYILPAGRPHAWESRLWDYKRDLPSLSGRGDDQSLLAASVSTAELVKDIVSFHNSFGGYIVGGIDHQEECEVVGCKAVDTNEFQVDKLNEKVFSYTKKRIMCKYRKVSLGVMSVGVLFVPKRLAHEAVVRMQRGAPERAGKSPAFKKGDIYARLDDRCTPINSDIQGIQFVCSPRLINSAWSPRRIENNLPVKDPNLIRFVGRSDYLLKLWTWLTDRHSPIKVLTALGGAGKTSIAYEFCQQIVASPPHWAEKVVWLTAKTQSYSAIRGEWVKVARTDFSGVNDFLSALALELGSTKEDLVDSTQREDLLDLVIDGLEMFPSLVVIDDIDSLPLDEQADLFAIAQLLAGRTFSRGNRFLLTSRLELGAGEDQRISLGGFPEPEFAEYARMMADGRGISLTDAIVLRLHRASLGSPTFCASILRLVSLGDDINQAIKRWRAKDGEDVRKFAFKRELDQLTDSQARTLFALSLLGQTTQLELGQVLDIQDSQLTRDLARLREYHLFASSGDPSTGTKLEVPEPIRLMTNLVKGRLHDPVRIERECAKARANVPKVQDRVALAIASVLALWKEDDYDAALMSARQARKDNPKNGDIHCVFGQCLLKVIPQKPEDADKSFRQARQLGCKRPELMPNWMEAKYLCRDWQGIIDLREVFGPSDIIGYAALVLVGAYEEIASQQRLRGDDQRAMDSYCRAMELSSSIISQQRAGDRITDIRESCRSSARLFVQLRDRLSQRMADRLDVFDAVYLAFECHVTETWMLLLGIEGLVAWTRDVRQRPIIDWEVTDIIEGRWRDVKRIHHHLLDQNFQRDFLLSRFEREMDGIERFRDWVRDTRPVHVS